jgi:hypothetical protein
VAAEINMRYLAVVQARREGDRMAFFVGEYALLTLFLAWGALWGGAARLEGSFFAELVAFGGVTVMADGLKVLAWFVWLLHTGWFLWGLGDRSVRLF